MPPPDSPTHADTVALFRYGLIADLLHLPAGDRSLHARLREKATRAAALVDAALEPAGLNGIGTVGANLKPTRRHTQEPEDRSQRGTLARSTARRICSWRSVRQTLA